MEKTPERRGGRRIKCFLEATCETFEGSPPVVNSSAVILLNLSLTGVSLSTSHALERRSMFYLKLPNPARNFWCGRLTRVVHAKMLPPSHYLLGCEFGTPLSDNELHTLLGHVSAPERRRFPRYALSQPTTEHLTVALEGHDSPVTIQDISMGGVSLVVDRQIAKGSRLKADFHNAASGTCCIVALEALHVRPAGSKWLIGCAFPEKLGRHELLGLLS